ncbi:hypothetical protein [Blastopirellula retiformator]|uniref:Uncharacterized protein n=1 Tax=Blastopirellula retiformator TaxID=2527970 RepID=A0A5C5VLU8_9BACT|nr:hypothetical protein [Blastopirellula retiformator]TWT39053.1 hypothetical protein Enr8_07480 [Blastopirellula retiformator]
MSELVEGAGDSPRESPPVRSVSRWKTWPLRMVLASLVAAAPLIIVPDGSILLLVSVIGGCLVAFVTVLFLNAQYLPALNIAITPGLLMEATVIVIPFSALFAFLRYV